MILLRFAVGIWIFGFFLLAASATSSFLFSSEAEPTRSRRWHSRLRASTIWPIALLSAGGRARLRNG
jgi:hypothetical protein